MADPSNDHADRDERDEATASADREEESTSADVDEESPDQTSHTDGESSSSADTIGLGDAQERAREAAEELLEHEFEGVIKVETADDDGWRTVVEVVERDAVPDTQDIIGRYEITLDATGSVTGYELLERYRRGDMKEEL